MKKIALVTLFLAIAGIQVGHAQLNAAQAMKSFTKTKSKVDGLTKKYQPYKDLAINNAGMVSPEIQTNMRNLDSQVTGLSKKLDKFPTASGPEQIAMASSFSGDFKSLKKSTNGVTKSIKGLKLPKLAMPKM